MYEILRYTDHGFEVSHFSCSIKNWIHFWFLNGSRHFLVCRIPVQNIFLSMSISNTEKSVE